MRALLTGILMTLTAFTGFAQAPENAFTVMTFNIRYDNPDDPNPWQDRKDEVAEVIAGADIIGLQEALKHQIDDLAERLPGFAWFGVGRDDGEEAGEYTCIFYRKDRFDVVDQHTFWLSETPDEPGSKSWDAAITRIATWGKFKDKKRGNGFYVFNTHFDHRGREARYESARLLSGKIEEIAGSTPAILTGDFNTREYSDPYKALIESLKDARYLSGKATVGPRATYTNWREVGEGSPIDYIFVTGNVNVYEAVNVDDTFRGFFPSDHLPVKAVVKPEN